MAVIFKISTDLGRAQDALSRLAASGRDLRPTMAAIGRAAVVSTKLRFKTGRAPDGSSWKKGLKKTGDTLVQGGYLRDSITSQLVSNSAVEVGSNRVYSRIHQLGGTIVQKRKSALRFRLGKGGHVFAKRINMPARPYLGINAADEEAFLGIVIRHLGDALEG